MDKLLLFTPADEPTAPADDFADLDLAMMDHVAGDPPAEHPAEPGDECATGDEPVAIALEYVQAHTASTEY
jgi:hypothetical protein